MCSLLPNLVLKPSKAQELLFTKMRDIETDGPNFVRYAKRSMRLLAEEALAELPLVSPVKIQTPCGQYSGKRRDALQSLCAVSIVRSGDALLEAVREIEPSCSVGKILIQRDESLPDKPARLLYIKLPQSVSQQTVLLCDPMLATGGSAIAALNVLCNDHGVDPACIVFANMICCPEGVHAVGVAYPAVKIVSVMMDEGLNDEKYIVPGLGDYGDRFFQTV